MEVFECLRNESFSFTDVVLVEATERNCCWHQFSRSLFIGFFTWINFDFKAVSNNFNTSQNLTGTWSGDFTDPIASISFNRDDYFIMSTNFAESYTIMLNKSVSDTGLVLHDPDFFVTSTNPATVPRYVIGTSRPYYYQIYIEVTEVQLLNLPNHPCEESQTYSYNKCVRNYVNKVWWWLVAFGIGLKPILCKCLKECAI